MPQTDKSILVVDDSSDTLELLRRTLSQQGFVMFTAPDVTTAVGVLKHQPVDLVITDLRMPKISGLELIRHVRENCQQTGIIMITGYASVESAVAAIKEGAEEYLSKPFTNEELLTAVRKTLDKVRLRLAANDGQPTPTRSAVWPDRRQQRYAAGLSGRSQKRLTRKPPS